ncbi:spore coat protein E [Seinonella peptonophila]|uniref:Spore coat protein E n=1 Tax=Seinonella peptonophila TaxID=112248 RepID=A0A1M4T2E9_9BACL|nr:outer spore coat protein CotE [Seinonella peptonophila]SHE38600.1 spore coat protein E [Seinonella peptonophila]
MSNRERPHEYRQIITKALCGRGRKFCQEVHHVPAPDNINAILGAWVINHSYTAIKKDESVEVSGSYDINIWYSTKGNTKTDVVKETVNYEEQIPLIVFDESLQDSTLEVNVSVTQTPSCVEATLSGSEDIVVIRVEKEFVAELFGETKICVAVYPDEYSDVDDKGVYNESESGVHSDQYDDLDPELIIDDLND